jgi:hypothetical protein
MEHASRYTAIIGRLTGQLLGLIAFVTVIVLVVQWVLG